MTKNQNAKSAVVGTSRQRYILQTPRKLRRSADLIRGMDYVKAVQVLRFSRLRASTVLLKKLVEAAANASAQKGLTPDALAVSKVAIDEGPTYLRYKARAQGRMYKRLRRTSHISIELSAKG